MTSHINLEERIKIKALHDQGHNAPATAKYLNRQKQLFIMSCLSSMTQAYMTTHMHKNFPDQIWQGIAIKAQMKKPFL